MPVSKWSLDADKLRVIRELSDVPTNCGEQWINVMFDLDRESGEIRFGWQWKREMGTDNFSTLDECIHKLQELRAWLPFNMVRDTD